MQETLQLLQKYFGYSSFQPMQEEIINDLLSGKDVFVLMPTGSGKSLCYQLPAVMGKGITVVVSPLISLMKDQVDSLRANGIGASFINSSLKPDEIDDVKMRLLEGKDRILYIAPERLASQDFLDFLCMLTVNLFAIDEAHCVSEWGHDFRPEYRRLMVLRQVFPSVPIAALTATAVPVAQQDIIKSLRISPKIYKASFNRKNLVYYVRPKEEAMQQIIDYIKQRPGDSGIVYCQSRQSAEKITAKLQKAGVRALPYHAGLASIERDDNQEKFIHDDIEVIVATIAFGMGINKTNVRYVIHHDLPKNLESYYQETGRAGRDGLESDCILFYSYGDRMKISFFIEKKYSKKRKAMDYEKLNAMVSFCESAECRRKALLGYFGEQYEGSCGKCDNCIAPRQKVEGTEITKKVLRCILDVEQRFGITRVVSVLTGSRKKSVSYAHQIKRSYGSGSEYTAKQWTSIIREIINKGMIEIAGGNYPTLRVSKVGMDVLLGRIPVMLTKPQEERIIREELPAAGLFEILRALRKSLADSEGVPPYIIFPDSTLREMASYYPQSTESLSKMHGVGEVKLHKYGSTFLEKIRQYCTKHNMAEKQKTDSIPQLKSGTYQLTLELCKQGLSLEEIAATRKMAKATISAHIENLLILGEDVPIDHMVSSEKQRSIETAIHNLRTKALAPLKESLGEAYSYEELRIARAKLNRDGAALWK